jgi:hypothetical protein
LARKEDRPPLDCGHDHEWVDIEQAGSVYGKKWADYRIKCEAIVVKTYTSLDERRHDRQPVYGGPLWENPKNILQLVRPIRWRVHHKGLRAYAELAYHGAATIQGAQFIESKAEAARVWGGLVLIERVQVQPGGPGRPKEPLDHNLSCRVTNAILGRIAKGKPIERRFIANDLDLKPPTLTRKLRESGGPTFSYLKKSLSQRNREH